MKTRRPNSFNPISQRLAPPLEVAQPCCIATSDSRPRHTYLIVMDTLNSSLAGSVYTREALKKLFKTSKALTLNTPLIAVGRTTVVIQNLTSDPMGYSGAAREKRVQRASTALVIPGPDCW